MAQLTPCLIIQILYSQGAPHPFCSAKTLALPIHATLVGRKNYLCLARKPPCIRRHGGPDGQHGAQESAACLCSGDDQTHRVALEKVLPTCQGNIQHL